MTSSMKRLVRKELTDIIKNTHSQLRNRYIKEQDDEKVWAEHILNESSLLSKYATAMHTLATCYWEDNNKGSDSRVTWIKEAIIEFFINNGKAKNINKEMRKLKHLGLEDATVIEQSESAKLPFERKVNVLDVGSCYDPFDAIKEFNVTAIDISPATESVIKCDFLNLNVVDCNRLDEKSDDEKGCFKQLYKESFDAVVFSYFLGYMPSPRHRFLCCQKAYDLLAFNGLLCIVSPDSKDLNANVQLYKLWKITLGHLGFVRIKYEKKTHFHAMVFRKGFCRKAWSLDSDRELEAFKGCEIKEKYKYIDYENISSVIHIPQDFNCLSDEEDSDIETETPNISENDDKGLEEDEKIQTESNYNTIKLEKDRKRHRSNDNIPDLLLDTFSENVDDSLKTDGKINTISEDNRIGVDTESSKISKDVQHESEFSGNISAVIKDDKSIMIVKRQKIDESDIVS